MNGIIIFTDKKCPTGTKKLGENTVFMDRHIDPEIFRKSEDPQFVYNNNVGDDNYDTNLGQAKPLHRGTAEGTGMEARMITLCQYPLDTDQKQIPKDSYFTTRNIKCPNKSSTLGQISVLDHRGQNNEYSYEHKSYIPHKGIQKGNPYFDYVWNLPTLCKANDPIDIHEDIILPSDNCLANAWSDVGTYGIFGSVYDYSFHENTNNINVDPINRFLPDQQIILPRMCAGSTNKILFNTNLKAKNLLFNIDVNSTNETIKRCKLIKPKYLNKCDEDMREICKLDEFRDYDICSCINSRIKLIGNPLYIDKNCIENGYKTYEMQKNMQNFFQKTGLINCEDLEKFLKLHPKTRIDRNEFTEHCFNTKPIVHQKEIKQPEIVATNYIIPIVVTLIILLFIGFGYLFIKYRSNKKIINKRKF